MDLKRYQRKISKIISRHQALQEKGPHLKALYQICLGNIIPVTEPIALISQIQRSGGSLLSQLFDGHPELHAHPHELKTGHPKKYIWPLIDLNDRPERLFNILFEESVIRHFKNGYKKEPTSDEALPFIFLASLQKKIFLKYLSSVESPSIRNIFDAYMTSYFGAWLNNQNFHGPKKFITAFTPRLAMKTSNTESFFNAYPDGLLISIVRNPKNWFPSAYRHNAKIKRDKYDDIPKALDQWCECARAMLRNKAKYGGRMCIIRFENLISDLESVMRYLAELMNIEFDPILLTPTFNKSPITANTSFELEESEIMKATLSRHETLKPDELKIIDEMAGDLYQRVLALTTQF